MAYSGSALTNVMIRKKRKKKQRSQQKVSANSFIELNWLQQFCTSNYLAGKKCSFIRIWFPLQTGPRHISCKDNKESLKCSWKTLIILFLLHIITTAMSYRIFLSNPFLNFPIAMFWHCFILAKLRVISSLVSHLNRSVMYSKLISDVKETTTILNLIVVS